jgi:Flp pilus assembly protein TadB
MSKERARRRAEREAETALLAAARAEREAGAARRRERRRRLKALLPRPVRHARQSGIRARRRRTQNAGVLVLFLAVQAAAWLFFPSWTARFAVLALSVLFLPVFVTLAFDRRGRV